VYISSVTPHISILCNSQINGLSMVNKSQEDALVLLRNTKPGGTVQLVVSRQALKKSAPNNVVMVPTRPLYSFIYMFRFCTVLDVCR